MRTDKRTVLPPKYPGGPEMGIETPLEWWEGEGGDAYTGRNLPTAASWEARKDLWRDIFQTMLPGRPRTVLEVGANVGQNLLAIRSILGLGESYLAAVEPNGKARSALIEQDFPAWGDSAEKLPFAANSFDLVFTSGVLIHIPPQAAVNGAPSPLRQACAEIVRVSKQWIVAIEYFSAEPREVPYRGENGRLWTRDFGTLYVEEFGLEPVACGFAWKGKTGLDNLTWWVLKKPAVL